MIKYIGSKRVLVPWILETLGALPRVRTALDLFSGTARVGHALKRSGVRVTANDHNAYAAMLARCYVQADASRVAKKAEKLLREMAKVKPSPAWFTETYCERARYFRPENGAKIEAMRAWIAARALPADLEAVLLVALMEAADRVDSTVGLQMAFLKRWAPRAFNPLELRMPDLLPGAGAALELDALDAARSGRWDVAYLDPPYNQHKYLGNYHVWETLVRWDAPEVYGLAQKRIDCRVRKSAFNSKRTIAEALRDVIDVLQARFIVVSFSDEGFLTSEQLVAMLSRRGQVDEARMQHRRYIGSKIGIYNPRGERVGTEGARFNEERLFVTRVAD